MKIITKTPKPIHRQVLRYMWYNYFYLPMIELNTLNLIDQEINDQLAKTTTLTLLTKVYVSEHKCAFRGSSLKTRSDEATHIFIWDNS